MIRDDGAPESVPRIKADEPVEFAGWDSLETILAGNAVLNLEKAGERLDVVFTARDACIRISSPDALKRKRGLDFLHTLNRLHDLRGAPLTQSDLDQALDEITGAAEPTLQTFFAERVNVSPRKPPVAARSRNQLAYLRAIRTNDVVFGIGPAGTGKTYLAMAMAVNFLLEGICSRVVLTRPVVEAGENLGFLPGKLEEKIHPYLRPLYDALYEMMEVRDMEELTAKGVLEIAPLAFMRGRTLTKSFIILDEAQNTTKEQMLMFLTRLGQGSKCLVCGDPTQTDLTRRNDSGLQHAVSRLQGIPGIAFCRFSPADVVRHSLVEKIIHAYQDPRNGDSPQDAQQERKRIEWNPNGL